MIRRKTPVGVPEERVAANGQHALGGVIVNVEAEVEMRVKIKTKVAPSGRDGFDGDQLAAEEDGEWGETARVAGCREVDELELVEAKEDPYSGEGGRDAGEEVVEDHDVSPQQIGGDAEVAVVDKDEKGALEVGRGVREHSGDRVESGHDDDGGEYG